MTPDPAAARRDDRQRQGPVSDGPSLGGRARVARALVVTGLLVVGTVMTANANAEREPSGSGASWLRSTDELPSTTEPELETTVAPLATGDDIEDSGDDRRTMTAGDGPPATGRADATGPATPTATATTVASVTTTTNPPAPPPIVPRPIPRGPVTPPPPAPKPPWANSVRTTDAGYVVTDLGCPASTSAGDLDAFFRDRMGPVIGLDFQHVYPLGGDRYLWLFQDTFVDQPGTATRLDQAAFVHNVAMIQKGGCFGLYHRGTVTGPTSFEPGTGEQPLSRWFWPMGGEATDGRLQVFWAEMVKDADPPAGQGLGWHPASTWLATYDAATLQRLDFQPAPNSGTSPIYGYAVASDESHTYVFGNTFDQNLAPEGGFFGGPHSATRMWLARTPRGRLEASPEYRTARGWSRNPSRAVPISDRFQAENPMQPRYLAGQWVAATKQDGYWGSALHIDVANDPWGPWTTVERRATRPRAGDPLMNTYHAYLMPWLSGGSLVVSLSQNARDMARDAFPHPERYRLFFTSAALEQPPPPPPPPTTTTTTTVPATTTTIPATTTTVPRTTTTVPRTTTTVPRTTTTTSPPTTTTTTTTTTTPPTTTSSSTSTTIPL